MEKLKVFDSPEFGAIRTLEIDDKPWFVGKDVADILGYVSARKAIKDHVYAEDKLTERIVTSGQRRDMTIINESGLYSLILSSKLPTAKKFKRWVTNEVLPAIRKHGAYAVEEVLNNPDMLISALTALKEERKKNEVLIEENDRMKPKEIFADAVGASENTILIRELAKLITQNGVQIGEKRLYQWLRDNKYLISRRGGDYNSPTQRSMNLGLFEIQENVFSNGNYTGTSRTTRVTGKGQQYFINKFLGSDE